MHKETKGQDFQVFKWDSHCSPSPHSKQLPVAVEGLLGLTLLPLAVCGAERHAHLDPACIILGEDGLFPAAPPCPQLLESRMV